MGGFSGFIQPGKPPLVHNRGVWRHQIKPRLQIVCLDRGPKIRKISFLNVVIFPSVKCMSKLQASQGSTTEISIPKVDISISPYDTAWVAMVPSFTSPPHPFFPKCLKWILENQNADGSWTTSSSPFLMKDALSSTLACIIALVRWNIGKEEVERGVNFILSNFSSITDEQPSPIGFGIIFPGMIQLAKELGLEIPINKGILDTILTVRDLELKRGIGSNHKSWETYLAYIAEGIGHNQNWRRVIRFQRNNGSLFNSPATTAAALVHVYDARSLRYLHAALVKYGNAVSASYPLDTYANLCLIDSIEKMGMASHFCDYIRKFLSKTCRRWLENEEEIHMELITCAIAFRLLRMHGYDVSSGISYLAMVPHPLPIIAFSGGLLEFEISCFFQAVFAQIVEIENPSGCFDATSLHDIMTALELYKASLSKLSPDDKVLEKLRCSTASFLSHAVLSQSLKDGLPKAVIDEVEYTLKFPSYANLERLEHRRYIENYRVHNNFLMLKSCIRFQSDYEDIVNLAVDEFSTCQSMYQDELKLLERWITESRLDKLKFARKKLAYCYFSSAATIFPPELSDARISWAKNSVLVTIIDDFFDIGSSQEEKDTFIKLVERWDLNYEKSSCSKNVDMLFSALYTAVDDIAKRAYPFQGYNITKQLLHVWRDLIDAMKKESEWKTCGAVPTMDDYMENGYVSFALGPFVLPVLYFIGPKLPADIIREPECCTLFKLVSTCGRLLNDIQGFEREGKEGKLNSVSIRMSQSCGSVTEEGAKREIKDIIQQSRTELLRLVLSREGSVLPQECKDLFWKVSRVLHFFYARTDGFTSATEMVNPVNAVIFDPLKVSPELSPSNCDKNRV